VNAVIYLDNAATTPVDPRVVEAMFECLGPAGDYANPAAVAHAPGRHAQQRVERARAVVAALVGADPAQVLWTSGATEADNLALLGAARFAQSSASASIEARYSRPASSGCRPAADHAAAAALIAL